jgi:putative acetyltransferase
MARNVEGDLAAVLFCGEGAAGSPSRFALSVFAVNAAAYRDIFSAVEGSQDMLKLVQAETLEQVGQARELFLEYAAATGIDLCFQNFDQELASLPGEYAPPSGRLFLALDETQGVIAGCVALRKIDKETCEMKRLYVRPAARGTGSGKSLALKIIEEARRIGYARMRLDTLPSMRQAIMLYRSLGFKPIEPYRYNPEEGALFMELDLA